MSEARGGRPLVLYLSAAGLARTADSGAAVAVVLAATQSGRGAAAAGGLAAALTAPHVLGPVLARCLDRARDGRLVLAMCFLGYAAAFTAAVTTLGRLPLACELCLVGAAGSVGPMLTGGMSSLLPGVVAAAGRAQERARACDAVTYGVAASAGPALVTLLAGRVGAVQAGLLLAGLTASAAGLVCRLPVSPRPTPTEEPPGVRAAMRVLVSVGPLRRVTVLGASTSFVAGAVAVVVLVAAPGLGGASLVTAFGAGNLAGALLLTANPPGTAPRGQEHRAGAWGLAVAGGYAVCAVAPSPTTMTAAFALTGAATAPLFTATLAVRSEAAPPPVRAQVFVAAAGAKVACGSLGSAVGGMVAGLGPRLALAAAAGACLLAVGGATLDRRIEG